eukprot:scaffold1132_cov238-Pinguiococcus_pyrenoidosus.AAC.2
MAPCATYSAICCVQLVLLWKNTRMRPMAAARRLALRGEKERKRIGSWLPRPHSSQPSTPDDFLRGRSDEDSSPLSDLGSAAFARDRAKAPR